MEINQGVNATAILSAERILVFQVPDMPEYYHEGRGV